MEYGQLYVIPGNGDVFNRKIFEGHLSGIQEFSDLNGLGYKFGLDDYQDAPCILAALGNLVIKTVVDVGGLIFYLPEYVSDEQDMWIFHNGYLFEGYTMVGGYQIKGNDQTYTTEKIKGLNNIVSRIHHNNILYNRLNKEGKEVYNIKKR